MRRVAREHRPRLQERKLPIDNYQRDHRTPHPLQCCFRCLPVTHCEVIQDFTTRERRPSGGTTLTESADQREYIRGLAVPRLWRDARRDVINGLRDEVPHDRVGKFDYGLGWPWRTRPRAVVAKSAT
jgi:hypothetical protein